MDAWQAALIIRPVPGGGFDALGSYPMTPLTKDADIASGLSALVKEDLISVCLVPDPLLSPPMEALSHDLAWIRPFKSHLLIEGAYAPTKHHRDRIRRGQRRCRIESAPLHVWYDEWVALYAGLVEQRSITGMANFSKDYFRQLSAMADIQAFAAFCDDRMAGMTLWFACDGVVYNHLTACNALGYANGAAFALYDAAITHFASEGVINLGGGAGTSNSDESGLFAFKEGFSNSRVMAHICGHVLSPEIYAGLSKGVETTFFPAYRA
ncbi:MAG: GNAT family N-acetyltransferase [Asticcacaulis sp.]